VVPFRPHGDMIVAGAILADRLTSVIALGNPEIGTIAL
jgi:hypothetical protein